MLKGHGGNLEQAASEFNIKPGSIIDFSSNVNTPIPLDKVRRWAANAARLAERYPDPEYSALRRVIAEKYSLNSANVLPGNGSTELLYLIPRALRLKRALVLSPSYADYEDACKFAGMRVTHLFAMEDSGEGSGFRFDMRVLSAKASRYDMVFLGNPNNPTGGIIGRRELLKIIRKNPRTIFMIDEAFIHFSPAESVLDSLRKNLIVFRSLTKFYGLPGVRVGFAASHAEVIKKLLRFKEPWTVNCFAEHFIKEIFKYPVDEKGEMEKNAGEREHLFKELSSIPQLSVYQSFANFLMVKINKRSLTAKSLREKLLRKAILIRDCSNFKGLDKSFFRIAVKKRNQNKKLVLAIRDVMP